MLRADSIRLVVMAAMAALLVGGVAQIWQLALLYAVEGIGTALFYPAANALLPSVVSTPQRQEENALLNLAQSAGNVVGPVLAGLLLAIGTPGWALAVNALSFGISAVFLLRLEVPRVPKARASAFRAELAEGWSEFSTRTWLWVCVLAAAITNAIFYPAFQVLGPTVAQDSLGGSSAWALIAASLGVGALIGGTLALSLKPRRPLLLGEGVAALIALPIALLAFPAPTLAIAAGALIAGGALSLAEILYETATQQHIPLGAMSRVSAYDWFGSLAIAPLGFLLIGPLATGAGISPTLWGCAALLVLCQLAVIAVADVRRVGRAPAT
jgi:MFS family permease